ncbi:hypothetical protein LXL04_024572 [Taraxacum kok-saghyz]
MEVNGVFEPPTPAKPVPARCGHNNQAASTSGRGTEKENTYDEFLCTEALGTKDYLEDDTSCEGVHESQDCMDSVPSPSETKDSRKRRNNGIDLNKKPSQRPRVKKHRPKIYDDSKPKKVPKVNKTPKPKTPKPVTPNPVQERRAHPRKISYEIEDDEATSRASIPAHIPCKRAFNLNLPAEIKSHHVSNSQDKHPTFNFKSGEYDFFNRVVTSERNTIRRSRFQNKIVQDSDNLLGEDDNKKQYGLDFSIVENLKQTKQYVDRFVYVYRCKKKSTSKIAGYKVYQRKFTVDQCLQNSKKSGPNFPKMFKKLRTMRKKVNISANWWLKFLENTKKKRPHRNHIQTTKKKVSKSKHLLPVFEPVKKKRSLLQKHRRQNLVDFPPVLKSVPDYDERFLLCQEENPLQITEYLPLEDVPIYEIKSFTSQPSHLQGVDNSVCALEWLKSREVVPVLKSQRLVKSQQKGTKVYAKDIKSLIKKFAKLDIKSECKALVVRSNGSRAIVVRKNGSVAIVKKKPKKPKLHGWVDLDEESLRVWKIVMENNGSQPFEETDNDKKEWWERQRNVFRGRVDSFIAKMHLIQGNRRFSPWKGSVVDSVVGVYLTQNVSDHLSSSAFMYLAARFPVKSKKKEIVEYDEVNASQESVKSNTEIIDEGLSNNDKMDQNMIASYDDAINLSQTTHLSQTEASNLPDKPCLDENPQSFRNLLDIDEVDYLKNFYYNNESKLNESKLQEKSTLEEDKPCVDENLDTFRKVLETEEADYLKTFCSINIDESSQTVSKSQEKSTLEEEKSILIESINIDGSALNESKVQEIPILEHEKSILTESRSQEKSTLEQEKSTLTESKIQEKSTLEEEKEARILDPVSMEQGANEVKNDASTKKGKRKNKKEEKEPEVKIDWEKIRENYCQNGEKERNENFMDAVDWDAVWRAPVQEIADMIAERGMHNVLADRIKDFLDRMMKDHGSLDLEWLRDVPPDKAKEFLLSIPGIGLKSVECVRLLTLHHNAFPVDTNVGRVATRLGWVPLQPLPEQLQIHLLNSYPMVDTIQKYLYPRLCTLDQKTLYELHYQLITFGKVFCTKISPNCNACPMRAECRHYASAYASARLALPGPKETSTVTTIVPSSAPPPPPPSPPPPPPALPAADVEEWDSSNYAQNCEPIVEVPASPEPYVEEFVLPDIEDYFRESDDEIPTIRLNVEEFKETLKETMNKNNNICHHPDGGDDMSQAIVVMNNRAASYRVRPMKIKEKLRTVHIVYELPDFHPILAGFDEREEEDPSRYLLAIWPETTSSKDTHEETVKGTVLIPCRTANRGKFPLNGTYFQVNEVFADDETSNIPMDVPRHLLWNLPRRDLCCGTSATSIFKALSTGDIQHIFWRGSICVRGFNRKTRQPRPLHKKFHISIKDVTSPGNKKAGKK